MGRHRWFLTLLAALALVVGACSNDQSGDAADDAADDATTTQPSDPLLVATTLGPVQGGESAVDGIRHFLNIPFAEPPTGENAWRPPQPREPWANALDATEPGPSCPQTEGGVTTSFLETPESDPDCLSLNVWTPDGAEDLPTMVWIHGGGLTTGSAHEPYYIGDDLASEGVVVVSMNYRLGPQGFLATDELAEESDDGAVGNYGFLDQQAALEWVQANIAGFGGDPEEVTIFGESAGGFSVCGHLAAPGSQGLFQQAIVQSGGGCARLQPVESAVEDGAAFMEAVGCEDIACLRELSDEDLIAVADFNGALVSDGVVLSETAYELAERGDLDDTPILIGSNADESTLFTLGEDEPTDEELVELVSDLTDDPEAFIELYPAESFDSNLDRYRAMETDVRFTCPTLDFASVAPQTYVYHYVYLSEQNPFDLGATHGAEISSLFEHPEGITAIEIERTDEGARLSDLIQGAWAAFATKGDPGEEFEPYADDRTVTLINVPLERVDEIRDGRCEQVTQLSTGGL
ncbi:MAG TPA: carboxylesterase family protein [Acidimicrobiia bacterium]|nr:carboxylesterase family protein [Acidimicrobiia bacterium]